MTNPLPPIPDKRIDDIGSVRDSDCIICRFNPKADPDVCTGKLYMIEFACKRGHQFSMCWHRPDVLGTGCPICQESALHLESEEVIGA